MPVTYLKNPDDGVVHVEMGYGSNEDTFCGLPTDGDPVTDGFIPAPSRGPATCLDCKETIDKLAMPSPWAAGSRLHCPTVTMQMTKAVLNSYPGFPG